MTRPSSPDPPRWRRWFAGLAGGTTSLAAMSVRLGIIPAAGLGRAGALAMVLVAVPYGIRAYVHLRIDYVMGRGNDETPSEGHKRRALYALVMLDFLVAAALIGAGAWYFLHPSNWQELGIACAAVVIIALSSDATIRLIQYFGLPRGSEVIERCAAVAWIRELAEHLRDVPGVSKLDGLWDKRTMQHRVSWLVVVLLSFLAGTVFVQTVAVAPEIERYFTHSSSGTSPDPPLK
jgi:hypothetical protein